MSTKLVSLCFFGSGFSGLLFEILWTRQLSQHLGGSAFSVSAVLTVFMAGLGLGAYFSGKRADLLSTPRLLLGYGLCEALAALMALWTPLCLLLAQPVLAAAYGRFQGGFFPFHLASLGVAALAMLPAAFAMGAGLPLLTRYLSVQGGTIAKNAGLLYGLNTVGAAFGAWTAGFHLLPGFGLNGTLAIGMAINLVIAGVCIRNGLRPPAPPSNQKPVPKSEPAGISPQTPNWLPSALFAISGFCALGFEVIWTKLLALILGPTTYAFSLVLFVFILGLGLGSRTFAVWRRALHNPWPAWAMTQTLAALAALLASQKMGTALSMVGKIHIQYHDSFFMLMAMKTVLVTILLLPATFFFGAALPLAVAASGFRLENSGRGVGNLYGWNVVGAVTGAWFTGFVVLPFLGKETGIKILVATLSIGVAVVFALHKGRPIRWALTGAILAVLLTFRFPGWDHAALARTNAQVYFQELQQTGWVETFFQSRLPKNQKENPGTLLYSDEALEGFVAVWSETDILGIEERSLFLSGKADASTRQDMFTQAALAHIPMSMRPRARRVMVLGLASGITAAEVLSYPVERLDVLEINPKVRAAARFFEPWNTGLFHDPRARLVIQDAKTHLLFSPEKYDVIISEPSNPWMAGLSELFTKEFYQSALNRLNADGVLVQFIHSYQMDWPTFALVGRTFNGVFENSLLMRTLPDDRPVNGKSGDYLLIGIKGTRPFSISAGAGVSKSRNVDLTAPYTFHRMVAAQNLGDLFQPGPLHTENHPVLEFQAPRLMFTWAGEAIEAQVTRAGRLDPAVRNAAMESANNPQLRAAYARYALSVHKPFPEMASTEFLSPEESRVYRKKVEHYCTNDLVEDYSPFAPDSIRILCASMQMGILDRLSKTSPRVAEIYLAMAHTCLANGILHKAVEYFRRAASQVPGTPLADFALERARELVPHLPPKPGSARDS